MGFFKRLSSLFGPSEKGDDNAYWLIVQCNRCGETIRSRVDLRNDLSLDYGEGGGPATYICHKTLIGENRCFQRIEVDLRFDANRNLIERKAQGGKFVDEPGE